MHDSQSPLSGQTVQLSVDMGEGSLGDELSGQNYVVEDWWDRIAGKSWMVCDGNPACLKYAMRSGFKDLPIDNSVLYGKVGGFGHLVHISEVI